jgi:23S rRNA pseudouridine2605 synthase
MPEKNDAPIRLQVYLARAGVGSRRACEELIAQGKVRVDGRVVREQGTRVSSGSRVELAGRPLRPESHVYLAVHKPAGYICSNRKMGERPIVAELYRGQVKGRLFHVGRLDALSSGLLLVTNDGEFANTVAHPSREVEKEYLVDTVDVVPDGVLRNWQRGITVEGVRYAIKSAERHSPTRLSLTLVEGKNREIRRMLEAFAIRIRHVHRLRIGPVTLRGLPPGAFRPLSRDEVATLARRKPRPPRAEAPSRGRRLVHKNAQRRPKPPLT